MQIQYYKNIKSPRVEGLISVKEWVDYIKQDSDFSQEILRARKHKKNSKIYNEIKLSVPCVTFNFLFDKYKVNENIIGATGFMFIDVDHEVNILNDSNKSKIYALYKSFGGKGWSIIVKVKNLTPDNFNESYNGICSDLGIIDLVDIGAIKMTQYSVFSFDPNAVVNPFSFEYNGDDFSTPPSYSNLVTSNKIIDNKIKAYSVRVGGDYDVLRYDNLDDIEIPKNENHIINWEGYSIIKCYIPYIRKEKGRNSFLLSYCNNLVWLNPNITKERAMDVMTTVNNIALKFPAEISNIKRVVSSIFKYKENGTLKPIYFEKKRKIVFNRESNLSKEDKRNIVLQSISEKKVYDTMEKLRKVILAWDKSKYGDISCVKIYKNFPISKKSVEKYYKLFKEEVQEIKSK
jgi:hypothetical protein